jgi:hypothetical protein
MMDEESQQHFNKGRGFQQDIELRKGVNTTVVFIMRLPSFQDRTRQNPARQKRRQRAGKYSTESGNKATKSAYGWLFHMMLQDKDNHRRGSRQIDETNGAV